MSRLFLAFDAVAPNVHRQSASLQGRCHLVLPQVVVQVHHCDSIHRHDFIVRTQPTELRRTACRSKRCPGKLKRGQNATRHQVEDSCLRYHEVKIKRELCDLGRYVGQ